MRRPNVFWNSIRWRIFTYYTLLITVAVILLIAAYVVGNLRMEKTALRNQMRSVCMSFMPIIFPPPAGPRGRTGPRTGERSRQIQDGTYDYRQHPRWEESMAGLHQHNFFLVAANTRNETLYASENAPADLPPPTKSQTRQQFQTLDNENLSGVYAVNPDGYIAVGIGNGLLSPGVGQALLRAIPVGLGIILLCSIAGYWIIAASLRPIGEMSATAQNIMEGNLSQRFMADTQRTELEQLARLLNQAFQRVQNAYQRQVQFTADASHELRTPVAAILADCQFSLEKPRDQDRYRETIEVCHESAQHMRLMLDQLGVLAAFDHPDLPIERERVDLHALCQATLNVVGPLAPQAGVRLRDQLFPSLEVTGDALRISQTIINLLKNAIHYNHPGGSVTLRTRPQGTDAVIEVEDTGVGIPAEKLEIIFERFTRLDKSRSGEHHNFGLGLAITQSIVHAHAGRVTVSSVVGQGSTFRIFLPLAIDE